MCIAKMSILESATMVNILLISCSFLKINCVADVLIMKCTPQSNLCSASILIKIMKLLSSNVVRMLISVI